MNLAEKMKFLAQGYIEEYVEELYGDDQIRISLNCKKSKIWVEINNHKIDKLDLSQTAKINAIHNFIEQLLVDESNTGLETKLKRIESLFDN